MATHLPDQRAQIEQALRDPLVQLPADLVQPFYNFQNHHYRRFLLLVNWVGQAAYLLYGFADMFLIPDVGVQSFLARAIYVGLVLLATSAVFRWSKNILLLDLWLPVSVLGAALIWFELLARSSSPYVGYFQYASVIFIVLANLSVQVRFMPSLGVSLLISAAIAHGVYRNTQGDTELMLVFALVYLPVLFFSLFISASTTRDRRKAFLRATLDEISQEALFEANLALDQMAHTDDLTGLENRRRFERIAELELLHAQLTGGTLSLLLFDVDHFKRVNDTYGHDRGDQVLQVIARIAREQTRENDLLARFGGEEFVVLLPDTPVDEAAMFAERLRNAVAGGRIALPDGELLGFTVSVGVSSFGEHANDLTTIIKAADDALYRAKHMGRNCVAVAEEGALVALAVEPQVG